MNRKVMLLATVPQCFTTYFRGQPRFLAKHFDVIVVTSPEAEFAQIEREEGVRVVPVPMTRRISPLADARALLRLIRLIRQERPALVQTYTPKAGLLGMIAAAVTRVPCRLHTVLGLPHLEAQGARRAVLVTTESLTYTCATDVFSISRSILPHLPRSVPGRRPAVIGNGSANGIDCTHFRPEAVPAAERAAVRASLGIASEEQVVVFVGRIVRDKGVVELLTAFERLAERHTVRLVLVGREEPDLDPVPDSARDLMLRHPGIARTGWVDDSRPYIAIADVLVLPSYREGLGNVLLEAGAMGVPCVTTDIPGPRDVVTDGHEGLLVPPKDALALEKALGRLLADPDLRHRLGTQARESVVRRYSEEEFQAALLTVYRDVLARRT